MAAREPGGLGRGEHEGHELGRLLERLQQGVPGVLRDLVRLVEDVDLALELAGRVRQSLAQLADGVDAAVAGGVDLDQVQRRPFADRHARRAGIAGVAVAQVGAVDGLGQDPCQRRLAGPARSDEQDRVRDVTGPDGVPERLDDGLLADDLARTSGHASGGRWLDAATGAVTGSSGRWRAGSKCRAPSVDQIVPVPTMTGGSDQAVPRHPAMIA